MPRVVWGAESDEPSQTRRRKLYFRGKPAVVCGNRAVVDLPPHAARYLYDRHRALQSSGAIPIRQASRPTIERRDTYTTGIAPFYGAS